jgi:hypothetical protein
METIKTPLSVKIISDLVILIYPLMYMIALNDAQNYFLRYLDILGIVIPIILLFVLIAFFIFLGVKLWKGKNYSRITIIVLSVLAPFLRIILDKLFFPHSVYYTIQAPISGETDLYKGILLFTIICLPFYLTAAYLLFSKKVKLFFNSKKTI